MQILTQIFAPYTLPLSEGCLRRGTLPKTPTFSINPLKKSWSRGVAFLVDWGGNFCHWAKKDKRVVFSAVEEGSLAPGVQRKRKVVEHICLFKAKEDLSEEQEKDMLDYLYTTQYHMRGIVALSLGDLYNAPYLWLFLLVLKEFNYGVELVLLIAFRRSSLGGPEEDAMTSLENLTMEFPSLIVQATKGPNLNMTNMEYTHGVVIRFRSSEAFKIFHEQFRIQYCKENIHGLVKHAQEFFCLTFWF
ncbi:hypothetical protein Sango_2268600 [Sesamum angolense]|uniref:Uncharacterized protein n=1 Tax=Sesamum angolense TaxID=2727404 RepID=A0AAE2BL25_9LAMI|nr:hypothetical protein Sango_2268600 [Sesamum angolense]